MAGSFSDFFRAATGHAPFDYQRRLAEQDPFPELLDVPTGLGKTAAAVLAWLWRRRLSTKSVRATTPRRLVYCLPMRVLVDQTHRETVRWLARCRMLAGKAAWSQLDDGDIPAAKAELRQYNPDPDPADRVVVHVLMGGEERTDWAIWPERDAILIGTQDMLLSRALNRGYAAGRARWPMEFGLLNNDCLWVFDEVQLMGSGLATSLQLQAWRESLRLRPAKDRFPERTCTPVFGPARSLWMSATTAKHWFEKAVDWRSEGAWSGRQRLRPEEKRSGTVGRLFKNRKRLSGRPIAKLEALAKKEAKATKAEEERQTPDYLAALATKVIENRAPDGLTLVVMNTVERATGLYVRVKERAEWTAVHLVHSRFRPHERQAWRSILSKDDPTPRIIVSTQVVEAGVDFSAQVLFAELAPWASLVQRFGRCARYVGESGAIYWMDLEGESAARPYEVQELRAAREQLAKLTDAGLRTLAELRQSLTEPETEVLFPYEPRFVPREKDLFELFDTTPDLTGADIDISRFIRDDRELDVMVYWRDVPDEMPGKAERPLRDELCPVAFHRFRKAVGDLRKHGKVWRRHYRKGWEEITAENTETIYPGQVFLLRQGCGGYSDELGWTGNPDEPVRWVETAPCTQPENEEVDEADDQCESPWLTIAEHCRDVCRHLEKTSLRDPDIASAVGPYAKILSMAARWHDRGKAHPAFKAKLQPDQLASDEARQHLGHEPAAKAPKDAWLSPRDPTLPRPGFRHELASALAGLETLRAVQPDHPAFAWPDGLDRNLIHEPRPPWIDVPEYRALTDELVDLSADDLDLFVYLVASHHGKVRMALRSSPDDSKTAVPDLCPGQTPQARGVRDGDELPACSLPGQNDTVIRAPKVTLHLDPMSLGLSDRYGPSWRERTQALLERLGPFRLAYLEALLRAADCRASSEERESYVRDTPIVREEEAEYERLRADAREFVERWRNAGPALEEQRYRELQDLDDETARRMTSDVFELWRPREVDDFGAGLVEQQRLFAKLRQRELNRKKRP